MRFSLILLNLITSSDFTIQYNFVMLIVIIFTGMSSIDCISGGWDWRRRPIFQW